MLLISFFFPLYMPLFSYMKVVDFCILFSPSSTLPIFLTGMGKAVHFSELCLYLSASLKSLFWLNLLFWLFSFSIPFLLCWAIRFHMLFFDPKKLSFTWCLQVSGNLTTTMIDIYGRYSTANYLLSGLSILSGTRFCEITLGTRILSYICIHLFLPLELT